MKRDKDRTGKFRKTSISMNKKPIVPDSVKTSIRLFFSGIEGECITMAPIHPAMQISGVSARISASQGMNEAHVTVLSEISEDFDMRLDLKDVEPGQTVSISRIDSDYVRHSFTRGMVHIFLPVKADIEVTLLVDNKNRQ